MNETHPLAVPLPHDLSPWAMFLGADPVVQTVMVGLFLASVLTWTVLLVKAWEVRAGRRLTRLHLDHLQHCRGLAQAVERLDGQPGPIAQLVRAEIGRAHV